MLVDTSSKMYICSINHYLIVLRQKPTTFYIKGHYAFWKSYLTLHVTFFQISNTHSKMFVFGRFSHLVGNGSNESDINKCSIGTVAVGVVTRHELSVGHVGVHV